MKDLCLDLETHDLKFENYDLSFVDEVDRVRQQLKIRLLFLFGEWFLDSTQGIRYFDMIMVKNPDMQIVDGILKATIIETPDVISLEEYSSEYVPARRQLTVAFTAKTKYGSVTITTGVP